MKKLFALVLILALALFAPAALAEQNASIVRITDMKLSYASPSGSSSASFRDANLLLALGVAKGAPTLQLMFESGEGQAVDAVMQIVEDRILFSMGGLSATYAFSLDRFATDGNTGADIGRGLTQALTLAGAHLDVVLYAITMPDESGMRSLESSMPMPQLMQILRAMLSLADGTEAAGDMGLDELQARMERAQGEARLSFRYSPETGAFDIAAIQDGTGIRLTGTFEMAFEPMEFIDITSEDVEIVDAANLTDAQRETLQGELGMLFPKLVDYAGGAGLDGIAP